MSGILALVGTIAGRQQIDDRMMNKPLLDTPIKLTIEEGIAITKYLVNLIINDDEYALVNKKDIFPINTNDGSFICKITSISELPGFANGTCYCNEKYICFRCVAHSPVLNEIINEVRKLL